LTASRLALGAEAALLIAVLLAPWPYGSTEDSAAHALACVLLVTSSLGAAACVARGRGLPPIAVAAAALPCLAMLQLAAGRSAAPVWTAEAVLMLSAMLAALVFWSERAQDRRAAERLAVAVLAVCVAETLFGAAQSARGIRVIYGQTGYLISTPFGSYVNHNHFAGLMEMGTLLAAGWAGGLLAAGGRSTAAGLIVAAVSLALAAAHLASRSRAGLVALAVGAAVLSALALAYVPARARVKAAAISATALLVLAVFALVAIPAAARQHLATLKRGAADPSASYRFDVAGDTLRLARARPLLGWGLGAYADAFPAYKRRHGGVRTVHAENDVFEFLAEGGAAGLLLAVLAATAVLRGLHDRLSHSHDRGRNGLALGAVAGCAALLAHAVADFNLRIPANALVFASLAGLAAAPRSQRPSLPRWTAAASVVVLVAMAAAAGWRAIGARQWDRLRGVQSTDLKLAALERLLMAHPYLDEAQRAAGLAWREVATRGGAALAPTRLARSEQATLRALRLRPRWGEAWGDLAWTRYLRGDAAGTRDALGRSRGFDPTNLPLGLSRADLLARLDGPAAAVAELVALRHQNPYLTSEAALATAKRWTTEGRLLDALRGEP
jgi:O-antigen ligase